MRRTLLCTLLLCLAGSAWAGNDPFADFRIPAHRTWSGDATFSLSASRNITAERPQGRSSGDVTGALTRRWESDALRYSVGIGASGRLAHDDQSTNYTVPTFLSQLRARRQSTEEAWSLAGAVRTYPWRAPVGLDARLTTTGAYQQRSDEAEWDFYQPPTESWTHRHSDSHDRTNLYENSTGYDLTAGLGRVRDATVVYRVHVLEGRLLETGALARPLSHAARERLAALLLLSLDGSLGVAHDRPARHFWREVERMVREDGALAGASFDAYALARAMEDVAPRGYVSRQRGWYAGPTVSGSHTHSVRRFDGRSTVRYEYGDSLVSVLDLSDGLRRVDWSDLVWVGGRAEFHRPLGWAWQVDLLSTVTRPLERGYHGLDARSSATVNVDLADRWFASAAIDHVRNHLRVDGNPWSESSGWWIAGSASLGYYLEDRTRLALTLQELQRSTRPDGFLRGSSLFLSVSHRFLGTLEAPGLIEPQRPGN